VRLAHLADVHLDAHFALLPRDVARRRRHALEGALKSALERAAAEEVDAVLIAGDLYEHERVAPNTGEFLRAQFEAIAPTPVFIAPGNHDWYGPSSLYARLDWPANVYLFSEDTLRPLELADGLTLWGAAHRAPRNTDPFLDAFRVDRDGVNLALFHGSEQGAFRFQEEGKVPHSPFRSEQVAETGLDHAFVGHFHTAVDAGRYTYPGNPEPLAFGESGDAVRGLVLATVHGDGTIERERVAVAQTSVNDVVVDVTGCASGNDVRELVKAALDPLSGCVRVTLKGELAPEVDLELGDLRRVSTGPWGVVTRVGRLTVGYDIDSIREEATVRGAFVTDVLAFELDDALRRKVIVTGLRALEGRNDLEVLV
jgi:DNA repair exonuclease SbcCD nuclease subunit